LPRLAAIPAPAQENGWPSVPRSGRARRSLESHNETAATLATPAKFKSAQATTATDWLLLIALSIQWGGSFYFA